MTDSKNNDKHEHHNDPLIGAYEEMLKRTREGIQEAQESTPKLQHMLESVRDNMVELGELTRAEAQKISAYIARDIELIEQRMLDAFTSVADLTSLELGQWAERARRATLYQAGQITGPGTLVCDQCGAEIHFTRTGRIPACADCGGLAFRRPTSGGGNGGHEEEASP